MSEIRTKLAPHLRKRVKFRGTFDRMDIWLENKIDVRRACVKRLEIDGEFIADHVWIIGAVHWERVSNRCGEQVEFTALVQSYSTGDEVNYCLHLADDPKFLHLPMLKIGGNRLPMKSAKELVDAAELAKSQPPPQVAVAATPTALQTLVAVKTFIKLCGGLDKADRILAALAELPIPVSELPEWLATWRDDNQGTVA
jgi:hypothetical protein